MKKRILSLILTLCVLAAMATVLAVTQVAAATVVGNGTCGATENDNVTWSLDSDGTMTISGTGAMADYISDQPWAGIRDQIKKVVIADGVTSIGGCAFENCSNLTSVAVLGDVEKIGSGAFSGCSKLESVAILGAVHGSTGSQVFNSGTTLKSIYFGSLVSSADFSEDAIGSTATDLTIYCQANSDINAKLVHKGYTTSSSCFTISGGVWGTDYDYDLASGVLTVLTSTPIEIANMDASTATSHRIVVASGVSANITLAGVNIENSSASPFEIAANSTGNVTVTLKDGTTNTLKVPSGDYAALQKEGSGDEIGTLTIGGTGKLIAEAYHGAGIGGNGAFRTSADVSGIKITGGTITAISNGGAGIGSGLSDVKSSGNVSNISISGGTITATSDDGAGIGSGVGYGKSGDASTITITGGTITATSDGGAGIGSGQSYNSSSGNVSNITISGGTITATSDGGAGIGCGHGTNGSGTASNIVITGGSVKATSTNGNALGCTPTDGSNTVTLYTLDNPNGKAVTVDGKSFPTAHTYYDGSAWQTEKKVYLYLTGNEQSIKVGDAAYMFVNSALVPTSGTCGDNGDNVTWKFDAATGTLTISGTGAMADYLTNQQPWAGFKDMIKKIVIEDGVTSIGEYAFKECSKLESVIFEGEIRNIGYAAFHNCAEMTSLTFGGYVGNIGTFAFEYCKKLTTLVFPEDVGCIGQYAFEYCDELKSVTFMGSVGSISYEAFYSCDKLTDVFFAADVGSIGEYAFGYVEKLANVYCFGSVTFVDKYAFYKCDNIFNIYCYTDNLVLRAAQTENVTTFIPLNGEDNGIIWRLTVDGTLTVSGSGDLSSYTADNAPWKSLVDNGMVKKVIIDSNVMGAAALFSGYHTVTFMDGTTAYATVLVADGETAPKPAEPTKGGYIFAGWYKGETKYDFTTAVNSALELTAKWEKPDYANDLEKAQKDLEDAVTALQTAVDGNKTDIDAEIKKVNDAIANLQTALSGKASQSDLNTLSGSVTALQTAVDALNAAKSNYSTTAEMNTAIESAVNAAKSAQDTVIDELKTRLSTAEANITSLTANKASKNELETAVNELKALINALDAVKDNYVTADTALKTELQAQINSANTALSAAEAKIAALESDVADIKRQIDALETAKTKLEQDIANKANTADVNKSIDALNTEITKLNTALSGKVSQTDYDTLKAAVTALQSAVDALNAAKNDYATADEALETKLNKAIKDANDAQDTVIKALTDRVTAAEEAVKKLQTDKADAATMNEAVEKLQKAIDALEAVKDDYKGADEELEKRLTAAIESAKDAAISAANDALEKAKNELNEAIDKKADATALAEAIETLNNAIATAQKAAQDYADAQDAAQKATLEKTLSDAESTLKGLIDGVQINLDKAVSDLNTAIDDGDKDLADKITALNTALETAQKTSEAADKANADQLNKAIADAQTALQAAVDKVASDLADATTELKAKNAELEVKDAAQQTFIVVVCVIACLSLAGNIAIFTVTFILKRKRIH